MARTGIIINQDADPSVGAGFVSGVGSLLLRENSGVGELWEKTGAGDTDWTLVGSGGGLPPQWTDGGNGDVTARVDDPTKDPITVESDDDFIGYMFRAKPASGNATNFTEASIFHDGTFTLKDANGLTFLVADRGGTVIKGDETTDYLVVRRSTTQAVFNVSKYDDGTGVQVGPYSPTDHAMQIYTNTGQTGNVLQVFADDFATEMFRLDNAGRPVLATHTAPADGDLVAGEAAIHFDDTDGSATPRWKGKSADGTVVSGSLGGFPAAVDPGDIADPTTATFEDIALKLNALMAAMRTAGSLA